MSLDLYSIPELASNGNIVSAGESDPEWVDILAARRVFWRARVRGTGRVTIQIKETGKPTKTYSARLNEDFSFNLGANVRAVAGGTGEISISETATSLLVTYEMDLASTNVEISMDVNGNLDFVQMFVTPTSSSIRSQLNATDGGKGHLSMSQTLIDSTV